MQQRLSEAPAADTPASEDDLAGLVAGLLAKPAHAEKAAPAGNEIVIGTLHEPTPGGQATVTWPTGPREPCPAASLVPITGADSGRAVALAFPAGTHQPLILGLVWAASGENLRAEVDGQHVEITATSSLTLRCGRASLTLTADGQVLSRGTYVSSHSTGTQRIKGAAVRIN